MEGNERKKIRLYRKNYVKDGDYTEYVYQIPLGLEFKDFQDKLSQIQVLHDLKSDRNAY